MLAPRRNEPFRDSSRAAFHLATHQTAMHSPGLKLLSALVLVGPSPLVALDAADTCPASGAGVNWVQQTDGSFLEVTSSTLPTLPTPTITSNYGPTSMCGFAGTIVVGGPLTLTVGKSFYGYGTMIRQSLMIFLDHINGPRAKHPRPHQRPEG